MAQIAAGVSGPIGGRFWANEEEVQALMKSEAGEVWDFAFSVGDVDPAYSEGVYRLKITRFDKAGPSAYFPTRTHVVEGIVHFEDGPRPFRSNACPDTSIFGENREMMSLCHSFKFTDGKEGGLFFGPSDIPDE